MQRRLVLAGAAGLFAPAIVPVGSLMALLPPVRPRWVRAFWVMEDGGIDGAVDAPYLPSASSFLVRQDFGDARLPAIRLAPGFRSPQHLHRHRCVIMTGLRRAADGRLVLKDVDGFRAALRAQGKGADA